MEGYDTRRDNGGNGVVVPPCTCSRDEFRTRGGGKELSRIAAARNCYSASKYDMAVTRNVKKKQKRKGIQELFTADYIVNRVVRKDGPPLGQEFDFLPYGAF